MKSFFKKETKEDKERKRQRKNGELSFNSTLSPDIVESTEEILIETHQSLADTRPDYDNLSMAGSTRSISLKLQSSSKSSIDPQQTPNHPPLLPKPKKGILKTISKFGIGPTLSNLSNSPSTPSPNTPTQPQVLINSSTNVPIVSSPKQQKSSYPKQVNSIEHSIPNYSKRNSQLIGHVLNTSNSKDEQIDNFLLPSLRQLPEVLAAKDQKLLNRNSSDGGLNILTRCIHVPIEQICHLKLTEASENSTRLTCDLADLPFLPGDELLSLNDQSVANKTIAEVNQLLDAYQSHSMPQQPPQTLPVHVRTALECSELIIRNTSNGMLKIRHADPSNLNLMNSTLNRETLVKHLGSTSSSSINSESAKSIDNENDSAWLLHTRGYSHVTIICKIKSSTCDSVKFKVRLENGNMIEVNEEDLEKINPSKYDFCEDLSQLQFINESSLMHTLRQRYQTLKLKHTYLGSNSLFVLSPNLQQRIGIDSFNEPTYSDQVVAMFKGCKMEEMPPHVYSFTQAVYRNMLSTRQDQSIVLMGHSGSGKSMNAKYILNYLFKIAAQMTANSSANLTESKLDAMFQILNAFCSIQTERNFQAANRFINIFLLEFNHSGQIASLLLQLISLDHTRLLYQANYESNYLIFYHLLFGSDSTLKSELQLDNDPFSNNLFFQSTYNSNHLQASSKDQLTQLLSAFEALNIKENESQTILNILASIILLGQAGAIPTTANSRFGQFNRPNEAHKVAGLLGVSFQHLNDSIFCNLPSQSSQSLHTKYGHLSNNGSSRVSPDNNAGQHLTPVECLEGFCLGLYQELLNMLTNLINRSFKNTSATSAYHQQSIANTLLVIDPPGFQYQKQKVGDEKRITNPASYSDLMCNYLNERLQLMFYQINFINPIEKCAQEGLDIDLVEHIPESPSQLVNWFDKPVAPAILNRTVNTMQTSGHLKNPSTNCGLLWLLEEQISSPQKSAAQFMRKLVDSDQKQHFISVKTNEEFSTTPERNFTVHHQFGQFPVEYNVNIWIEQYCKEYVTQANAFSVLQDSKKEIINSTIKLSNEFSSQNNLENNKTAAFSLKRQASVRKMLTMSKRKTFNVNFKLQLDSIFDSMRRTKCNFVFCSLSTTEPINSPDIEKYSTSLDIHLLRSQLKAYQLLAACRIYRQGFPEHLNLEDFERRFSMFAGCSTAEASMLQCDSPNGQDSHKKTCQAIINNLELDSSLYKFGITQVFFKAGVLNKLEDQRDKKLNNLIVRLQSNCRRYLAQKAVEKRNVQDSAIRCIQKNARISFMLKKWKWWKLYSNLMPIINVQNTETLFKQCKEELDEFKRKNERLSNEKNNLLVLNNQLESKFMNLQAEYIEEHSTNTSTVQLLEAESLERLRLDKELNELKPMHTEAVQKNESLEAELLKLRLLTTKQQIEDEMQSSDSPELDMMTVMQIDKLKRENESLRKQMGLNRDNEDAFRLKERNFFETKLKDKDNELVEAENAVATHKRKYQKLNEDMQDIQRLCDGLKVRNNELEKIQRKFDSEMNSLKSKFETEKDLREKCERERDLLKFEIQTVSGNLESEKMEHTYLAEKCERLEKDLKSYESAKFESMSSTSSGGSADQFIKMKNQIRDMETRMNDQEEELDDQQGVIQQLEQTKLRLQMQGEKEKSKWLREIAEKESEMDDLRFHTQKKIKVIEMQLEEESEISSSLQREKRELERKLKEFSAMGKKSNFMLTINSNGDINGSDLIMNNGSSIGDYLAKLKRQMQKYKMLAIDAQTQLEKLSENIPKQSILKALKSQLEDSEISKTNALKSKQMLQCELNELQTELEEDVLLRQNLEEQNMHLNREIINLKSQLEDQERDTDELVKKFQTQFQTKSIDSHHFIELNNQIDVVNIENRMLKEKIRSYEEKISLLETTRVEKSTVNTIESKIRDLEGKLDLEVTQKTRLQSQLERARQQYEKAMNEVENISAREKKVEDTLKKSQRQNKEANEEFGDVQKKLIDLEETKKRLESQNEILERELEAAKSEMRINLTRLETFQNAFNSMNDDAESDEEDSEGNYDFGDNGDDEYDQDIQLTCE